MAIIGALVSLDCGSKGYFQGTVLSVDDSASVTLQKPFCDGRPLGVEKTTLHANEINAIKVLKMAQQQEHRPSPITVAIPAAPLMTSSSPQVPKCNGAQNKLVSPATRPVRPSSNPTQFHPINASTVAAGPSPRYNNTGKRRTPSGQRFSARHIPSLDGPCGIPQLDKHHNKQVSDRNLELNSPLDYDLMRTDFDFESNLKLFDKNKDIDAKEYALSGEPAKVSKNFAHYENIVSDPDRLISWTLGGATLAVTDSSSSSSEKNSSGTPPESTLAPTFRSTRLVKCDDETENLMPMLDSRVKTRFLEEAKQYLGAEILSVTIADRLVTYMFDLMQRYDIMVNTVVVLGSAKTNNQLTARFLRHLANRNVDTVIFGCDLAPQKMDGVRRVSQVGHLPKDVQLVISLNENPTVFSTREFSNWLNSLGKKRCHFIALEHRLNPVSPLSHSMMIGTGTEVKGSTGGKGPLTPSGETVVIDVGIPFQWIAGEEQHMCQAFSMQILVRIRP